MRERFVLVSLVLVGAIGALAYSNATRTPAKPTSSDDLWKASSAASTIVAPLTESGDVAEAATPAASSEISSERVEHWIADSLSADRDKRSAAIIGLAQAPKDQAVPALREVLELGAAEPDRQLALRSLHAIAIDQGDEDGLIRDTFRRAMYHGDDEGVSQSAQAYLEDIEAAMEDGGH